MNKIQMTFWKSIRGLALRVRCVGSLALATFHHNKVFISINLGVICLSLVALVEEQKLLREAGYTLKECEEFGERVVEAAVVEEPIVNSNLVKCAAVVVIGVVFGILAYLALRVIIRSNSPGGPPSNVAISPELPSPGPTPSSSGEVSPRSVESQAGGGGLDLDDSSIESLSTKSCGFSEELTETDFSALVPETLGSSVPELLSNIGSFVL